MATIPANKDASHKIVFANQLRGVAVLCVVLSHYLAVFWGGRDVVAQYTFAPQVAGPARHYMHLVAPPTFNYGPFGVALFFLISGFVIPFSLEKMGRGRFLLARALRIYPSYWVGLALMLTGSYLSARYWGNPFHIDVQQLSANLFLINAELGQPSMDLVNWTLSVEIKFYLAAVLMWPWMRRGSVPALIGFAALVWACLTWLPAAWDSVTLFDVPLSIAYAKTEAMFICFLFIGTLFHFAIRKQISVKVLVAGATAMFALFFTMWQKTVLADQFWQVPANYFYALVVFSGCYAMHTRFRHWRLLDFFADISYPLYLVHAILGYALIHILMDQGMRFGFAAAAAFLCVTALATALHYVIELPTAQLGKSLSWRRAAKD